MDYFTSYLSADFSLNLRDSEFVAILGPSGSGKTTITNLVNRFYDIQKGEILIDGINIKDINKRSLRRHIGTILQDPFIFARSIKDNIKLNKKLSDEEIWNALKMASAEDFVKSLPNDINEISKEVEKCQEEILALRNKRICEN